VPLLAGVVLLALLVQFGEQAAEVVSHRVHHVDSFLLHKTSTVLELRHPV
jgi:hypothetical protein